MTPEEKKTVLRQAPLERIFSFRNIPITLSLSKGRTFHFLSPPMIVAFLTLPLFLTECVSLSLFPQKMPLREKTVQGTAADKILVVSISGIISDGKDGGVWDRDDDLVARIKEELTLAAEDDHIKALLLRINSPGGTVTASDIIYHEIIAFKEKRKIPVVAVIMDLGASGGYYLAVTGDRIIAHPTSVTAAWA